MEPPLSTLPNGSFVADRASMQNRWLRRSGLALIAIASVYIAATLWAGHNSWRVALSSISPRDLIIIVGLVSIGFLLRAARWHYYIRVLRWDVPLLHSISAFTASIALTATPGKSGELAKAMLLRSRHNISVSQGAGVLLIERLGDLFAVIALAIVGLPMFFDQSGYVFVSIAVIGSVGLLALNIRAVLMRAQRIPQLRRFTLRLADMSDAVATLMRPITMLIGASLAFAAWSCEALAFHYLVKRLGIDSSLLVSFSIYGLSTLAGALSMLPGGLGGVEAVMAFLLTRLAPPSGAVTPAVVIFRLCTLWLFSLIGAAFMSAWMIFLTRRRHSRLAIGVQ